MHWRTTGYFVASLALPFFAGLLISSFILGIFKLAWASALLAVVINETRVQIGERLPHTTLFWVHLTFSIPFFFALSALAFVTAPPWLMLLTAVFGGVTLATGGILWWRGIREVYSTKR